MKVKVEMRVSGMVFGDPAPRNVQVFSDFKGFLRIAPTSQFALFRDSSNLKGFLQISIGRFSTKSFGKRRKRRRATTLQQLRAFLAQMQTKIGFCGDTGVFEEVIVVIATQKLKKRMMIASEYLAEILANKAEAGWPDRSAQQRLLVHPISGTCCFGSTQFVRSQFVVLLQPFNSDSNILLQVFNFCAPQFADPVGALNCSAYLAHSIPIRGNAALFDSLFLPPPTPPHSSVSHSISAELLKSDFNALHSIPNCGARIQFSHEAREIKLAELHTSLKLSYLPHTPVLERKTIRQRGGGQPAVLRPAFWAADESGRVSLEAEGRSRLFNLLFSQSTSLGCGYLDAFLRALVHPRMMKHKSSAEYFRKSSPVM
jgi:hypothetical protein